MRGLRLVNLCLLLAIAVGFRTVTGDVWDVSPSQPTVWIEADPELYGEDGFGDKVDGLKGQLAGLKDVPASEQRAEIWRLMLDDFASVRTSFLRVRLAPGQIETIDAALDPATEEAYDLTVAEKRTIRIEVGASQGAASGFASLEWDGAQLTGCKVVMAERTLEDPQFFAHVLQHEILHCLGLEHQQEDDDSLMSYSNEGVGMSLDDRMALTHLYPLKPGFAKEQATFGMACTPSE